MVIKVLFVVLLLSTAAIVAVGLAIHFRVKRHLDGATPEGELMQATKTPSQDDESAQSAEKYEEDDHGESDDRNT